MAETAAAAGRKPYIAALKVLAIVLVIFNHAREGGFWMYISAPESPFFPIYLFATIASKVAVPIFFMCSGALLLGRDESLKRIYTHRVLRYAAVLLAFTFLEYLFQMRHSISSLDLGDYFRTIYSSNIYGFFWFLYAYLACLMLLPFLRKLARAMGNREALYLIALQVVFVGVIPALEYVIGRGAYRLNPDFELPLIAKGVFFMLIGYWAGNTLDTGGLGRAHLVWIGLTGFAAIALTGLLTVYKAGIDGGYHPDLSETFLSHFVAVPTITMFILWKCAFERIKWRPRLVRAVVYAGDLTFGIYLLHIMAMRPLRPRVGYIAPYLGLFPATILMVLAAAVIAGAVTALIRKIPRISKYI